MEELFSKLGEYGLLGLLLAIALFGIYKLFGLYRDTQEKRIQENREMLEVVKDNTISQDNNTKAITALGELIRAQRGN